MDVGISIAGDMTGDGLRSLRGWLVAEWDLRGRVELRDRPAVPGTMPGGLVDGLVVVLAGGGAVTAAARFRTVGSVLVTWLRTRRGDVDATVTAPGGGSMTLKATNVRGLDTEGVGRLLEEMVQKVLGPDSQPPALPEQANSPPGAGAGDPPETTA